MPDPAASPTSAIARTPPRGGIATWLRAMRARQWVKNLLVFLPLLFGHKWHDHDLVLRSSLAFVVFCMAASSVYLVNDLMDHAADRLHPEKRHRPLAAGLITRGSAWIASAVLLIVGAAIAWFFVSPQFIQIYALYVAVAGAYSMGLKKVMLLDAILLAGFYTLRIFAGSVATDIVVSQWLLLFSLFFFLGLAFQKRFAELRQWTDPDQPLNRRGYVKADIERVGQLGIAASYLAVLVLALYIQSPDVTSHYAQPRMLWWVLPCLLYWTSRLWLLAGRGELSEDAISFAVRDAASYATAAVVIVITLIAQPV